MGRILVVAPNWIGDALMAQPLLARLREAGAAGLDVLAPEWVAPVARRMPEVDEVIAAPFRHGPLQLAERWRLGRSLAGRYASAYVLPNTWKSALVPFFARIPQRIGYLGEARHGLLTHPRRDAGGPMVEHYLRLCGSSNRSSPSPLRANAEGIETAKAKFGISSPYTVFCPGAEYGPAKRWPYFKELAERSSMPVVLLGSAKDREACRGVPGLDLAGRTTLDEAIDLIAGAERVVSNDSGLMHVAAALGRPQVAIFGSSSPEHTPPRSARSRVLWLHVECSPCFQRECPLGHFRCMREIGAARVEEEMAGL